MGPGALRKGLESARTRLGQLLLGSAGVRPGPSPGTSCTQLECFAGSLNSLMRCSARAPSRTADRGLPAAWPEPFCLGEPLPVHLVGQVVQRQHGGPPRHLSGIVAGSDSGCRAARRPCGWPTVDPPLGHRKVAATWHFACADAIVGALAAPSQLGRAGRVWVGVSGPRPGPARRRGWVWGGRE